MFVQAWGNVKVIVPKEMRSEHQLACLLGMDAARKLAIIHCGKILYIPRAIIALRCQRDLAILQRFDQGAMAS
ncbi:MAG: hypothetical protein HQM03_06325 [Magnetococcales bacterium]|nr:hypothetical protein [Magnetococcales bacterium]